MTVGLAWLAAGLVAQWLSWRLDAGLSPDALLAGMAAFGRALLLTVAIMAAWLTGPWRWGKGTALSCLGLGFLLQASGLIDRLLAGLLYQQGLLGPDSLVPHAAFIALAGTASGLYLLLRQTAGWRRKRAAIALSSGALFILLVLHLGIVAGLLDRRLADERPMRLHALLSDVETMTDLCNTMGARCLQWHDTDIAVLASLPAQMRADIAAFSAHSQTLTYFYREWRQNHSDESLDSVVVSYRRDGAQQRVWVDLTRSPRAILVHMLVFYGLLSLALGGLVFGSIRCRFGQDTPPQ